MEGAPHTSTPAKRRRLLETSAEIRQALEEEISDVDFSGSEYNSDSDLDEDDTIEIENIVGNGGSDTESPEDVREIEYVRGDAQTSSFDYYIYN